LNHFHIRKEEEEEEEYVEGMSLEHPTKPTFHNSNSNRRSLPLKGGGTLAFGKDVEALVYHYHSSICLFSFHLSVV
jgi:hypothetical protein